ncbi:hypothetical protein pipiens_006505 [Culex pipiens pipiens]|uniref:Uncharacterized protein n=1 Tax=Culex pipiens pipiens TaxID=38569 RepID=A0ABD1DP76_CULPP
MSEATVGGFCGAIQRTAPPVPAGLARRMANREFGGLGKLESQSQSNADPSEEPTMAASGIDIFSFALQL